MADLLATVADLRTLLGEDATSLPDAEATLLLELATGAVQAAAGQVIVERTETVTLMGGIDSWLNLPERPVTEVTAVEIDGEAVTDYKRFGDRLWRECGWSTSPYTPVAVEVTYSHGYAATDPGIQLARSATLVAAAQLVADPSGKSTGFAVDDYREQYAQTEDAAALVPRRLRAALRRQYGPRGRLVRIG